MFNVIRFLFKFEIIEEIKPTKSCGQTKLRDPSTVP